MILVNRGIPLHPPFSFLCKPGVPMVVAPMKVWIWDLQLQADGVCFDIDLPA